jgi:hypothetical protein
MPERNWPFDWKRDREVVADLTPPPPPRPPAVVSGGRGIELALLEARRLGGGNVPHLPLST